MNEFTVKKCAAIRPIMPAKSVWTVKLGLTMIEVIMPHGEVEQ